MPKSVSWRKLVQKFRALGFEGPFSGGRHLFMVRESLKVHITNPHKGDISKGLVTEILRQVGINPSDWEKT